MLIKNDLNKIETLIIVTEIHFYRLMNFQSAINFNDLNNRFHASVIIKI